MTQLFVKYDFDNEAVLMGPQGNQPDDTWVLFIPAENLKPRQASYTKWIEELDVVLQIAGDEHVFDYAAQRRNAYPKIGEQLDKLFHDIDNGTLGKTGSFYETIKGVKDDIPKPEG
jgi:hypothetical protein